MKTIILLASLFASSFVIACPENKLCVKDTVINSENEMAQVVRIFTNGQAQIHSGNIGYKIYPVDSLVKTVED